MSRPTLLQRQLRRLGLDPEELPSAEQWQTFLATVDRTYGEAEQDRYTIERSLAISSQELRQLYEDLKLSAESQLAIERDKLREVNRFLDSIVENIPHMVFVKDAVSLKFVRFNRAGEELLGVSEEEMIGKSDFDFFPLDQATAFVAADRAVLAQRGLVTIEEEPIQTHAGTRRLATKKFPILGPDGAPIYLLGISEDITDKLHKRDELFRAKEAAEKATRAKSDFLMNMSHEMRTPLNAILGFGRVLEREAAGSASADHQEFLHHIVQASEHMLALVNDLLDLRSLEEDLKRSPPLGPVDLAPVIHVGRRQHVRLSSRGGVMTE